jgi:hypothetical protein
MATPFIVRHDLDCTPDFFWERVHPSDAFNDFLYKEKLGFEYEVIRLDPKTGERDARIVPKVDAPAAVKKIFGDGSFVERGRFDAVKKVYSFDIIPSTLADRIRLGGAMRMEPRGTDGCTRVVDFEVDARVFGLGGVIEAFVQRTVRASYDQSCGFTNEFIARLRAQG